jgi:hypothetical protein
MDSMFDILNIFVLYLDVFNNVGLILFVVGICVGFDVGLGFVIIYFASQSTQKNIKKVVKIVGAGAVAGASTQLGVDVYNAGKNALLGTNSGSNGNNSGGNSGKNSETSGGK